MKYKITSNNYLYVYNENDNIIYFHKDNNRWYTCDYEINKLGGSIYLYKNSVGVKQEIDFDKYHKGLMLKN